MTISEMIQQVRTDIQQGNLSLLPTLGQLLFIIEAQQRHIQHIEQHLEARMGFPRGVHNDWGERAP